MIDNQKAVSPSWTWALAAIALVVVRASALISMASGPASAAEAGSCVPARPHAAGDFAETIISGGVTREYVLHVPPSYVEGQPMPLILNWHGLGSNASDQQLYSGLPAKADTAGFIVTAPQGLGDPANHNFATLAPEPDDVLFTNDLLDELESQLCIDTARVFSTGMSNGAQMSTRLGCNASDRIAAIAPVAGWYYPPFSPNFPSEPDCISTRPVAVIAFHGTADNIIPFEGGPGIFGILFRSFEDEIMPEWAVHNGCDSTPVEEQVTQNVRLLRHENCDEDAPLELYVVEAGGHTWPGAIGATEEISATDLMWEFFLAHPMSAAQEPTPTPTPASTTSPSQPTATVLPALPTTGTGGSYGGAGVLAGIIAAITTAAIALGGAAWWVRRRRFQRHSESTLMSP